jgi:flavin-dependent dehydrogenase
MYVAAEHDVVVLGAGPGGAAAAIRLAEMGLDVGVVERQCFPRTHVGICISDATIALIDYLGVGAAFDRAKFWRRNLTAVIWGQAATSFVPQPGHHVDRGVLDQLLLRQSQAAGVRVYQPARIETMDRTDARGWRIRVALADRRVLLKARYIVDAAGRRGAIRGSRIKDGPSLLTLYASWSLASAPKFDGLIEAGEDAWLWYAQTASDRAVVSVFCDPRRLGARTCPGDRYLQLLQQFSGLKAQQLGLRCSAVRACDGTSQHAVDPIGDDYIRVGDACATVDPLASQGVHLALQSGLQAAIVVNTLLKKPEHTDAARQFFRMRVTEQVNRYTNQTRREYSRLTTLRSNAFWHQRASVSSVEGEKPEAVSPCDPADKVAVSPEVTFNAAPVAEGDYIEVRQVVSHPRMKSSVAYVESIDLSRLLAALPQGTAFSGIPTLWRQFVPPATAGKIALWLWNRGILVKVP